MEHIHRMENYLGHHPYIGAVVATGHLIAGFLLQSTSDLFPVMGELLRDGAWFTAICAGAFTCYGVWKTHHGKKKGKDK